MWILGPLKEAHGTNASEATSTLLMVKLTRGGNFQIEVGLAKGYPLSLEINSIVSRSQARHDQSQLTARPPQLGWADGTLATTQQKEIHSCLYLCRSLGKSCSKPRGLNSNRKFANYC